MVKWKRLHYSLLGGLILMSICISICIRKAGATWNNNPPAQPGFTHQPIPNTDDLGYGIRLSGAEVADSSPILADVDGDGHKEIFIGDTGGFLHAYRSDGTLLWATNIGTPIFSSPAIGDLNGDGITEVVVGLGSKVDQTLGQGGVAAFNARTGEEIWRFYSLDDAAGYRDSHTDPVYSSPALGDIDNDGKLEIAFGSWDRRIYLLNHQGEVLWEYFNLDSIWSSPAMADIDNDGFLEVIIGADISGNPEIGTQDGGYVYAFDEDGTVLWRRFFDQTIYSSPAVGDIDNDGWLEVVVGTGNYWPGKGYAVYALDHNGDLLWTGTTNGYVFASPALADLNGDGYLEVIVTCQDRKLYAWQYNGDLLWSISPKDTWGTTFELFSSPVVADVGNASFAGSPDGLLDVLFGIGWEVGVVNSNGQQLTDDDETPPDKKTFWAEWSILSSPAIGDIDNDGKLEVIAAGSHRYDREHGYLYAWEVANTNGESLPWPMFRQNAAHTGLYPRAAFSTFDDSRVISHTIPAVVSPGITYNISITFENTGSTTWIPDNYSLGAVGDSDPFYSGNRIPLPTSVPPSGIVKFSFSLTAPLSEGYYMTDWRMVNDDASRWFGRTAARKVKVGNQPAFHVLRGDGHIFTGGLAEPFVRYDTWPWDAARELELCYNSSGGYVFDVYGPWHYAVKAGMTYGPNEDLPLISTASGTGTNFCLREVDLSGSTYWLMDCDGNFQAIGGQPLFTSPTPPGNDQAISFALTPDRLGVYVLLRDGTILRGGNASIIPDTPVFSGEDRFRRIKITTDGTGYYVLDKYGNVYAGGQAQPIPSPSGFPKTEDVAVDFELTSDGEGYYLLTKDGGVHAAGSAEPVTINPIPTWTVDANVGHVARDLVLVDSRLMQEPVLEVSPSSLYFMVEPSQTSSSLTLFIRNKGRKSFSWSATTPREVTLSPSSGTVVDKTTVIATVDATGYTTDTYNLGEVVINATFNGDTVLGSPQSIPVTLYVGRVYRIYLPLIIRNWGS